MTANLADPALWYGLVLKIAMTSSIVVAASVVVERSGPFIGSLIAALPTAGGAAMIILALEHSPQFISQSAVGSLIANAACALFALSYAALAQKHGLQLSLGGAFLVKLSIDYGLLVPGVAGRRWPLAPNLAPGEPVNVANVRKLELIVDSPCVTLTYKQSPVKARPPGSSGHPCTG